MLNLLNPATVDVAFYLSHGSSDTLVSPLQSTRFKEDANNLLFTTVEPSTFDTFSGEDHFDVIDPNANSWKTGVIPFLDNILRDIPLPCNFNGVCEVGEDCNTCPNDCIGETTAGSACGNGICEVGNGEDCFSCPLDCNGESGGKPSNRYCCGGGTPCSDSRCVGGGKQCATIFTAPTSFCCGDTVCEDPDESSSSCSIDCGPQPTLSPTVCDMYRILYYHIMLAHFLSNQLDIFASFGTDTSNPVPNSQSHYGAAYFEPNVSQCKFKSYPRYYTF
jgi:hypothetical protein